MREAGQSAASADALAAWEVAMHQASDARCEVKRVERELRALRAEAKRLTEAERVALAAYEATPYTEEVA